MLPAYSIHSIDTAFDKFSRPHAEFLDENISAPEGTKAS